MAVAQLLAFLDRDVTTGGEAAKADVIALLNGNKDVFSAAHRLTIEKTLESAAYGFQDSNWTCLFRAIQIVLTRLPSSGYTLEKAPPLREKRKRDAASRAAAASKPPPEAAPAPGAAHGAPPDAADDAAPIPTVAAAAAAAAKTAAKGKGKACAPCAPRAAGGTFAALPADKFELIYCDPPWQYNVEKGFEGLAAQHYKTVSIDELCKLNVPGICAKDCVLVMWATWPKIESALKLMRA
jgi:hypothetical protein